MISPSILRFYILRFYDIIKTEKGFEGQGKFGLNTVICKIDRFISSHQFFCCFNVAIFVSVKAPTCLASVLANKVAFNLLSESKITIRLSSVAEKIY